MKKIILILLSIVFINFNLQAQAPEKFNYQGIARDASGAPMATQNLGLQISILDGTTAVYTEIHNVTTNNFGLYTLAVGDGTVGTGTMGNVDWSTGNKSIKVEIDPNGGTNYADLGTTELLSVPYAMYAASNGSSGNSNGWSLDGNAAGSDDFIGTTNNEPLRFKVNGQSAGFISLNTSFGWNSLSESSTGSYNATVGYGALKNNTSGGRNTAMGMYTLTSNTEGERNTAVGSSALFNNESGDNNSALGSGALNSNTIGKENTAIGSASLLTNEGHYNTAVGAYSLNLNTTGRANTAIGNGALPKNLTGILNTSIGSRTLASNTTGNYNIGIGAYADVSTSDLINAIAIGYQSFVSQDNSLVLGSIKNVNNAEDDTKVGIGVTAPKEMLSIRSNGSSNIGLLSPSESHKWEIIISDAINTGDMTIAHNGVIRGNFNTASGAYNSTSDRRLKENITPTSALIEKVKDIKIMNYSYKADASHMPQIGYIAQELEKQFPEFVNNPDNNSKHDSYYTVNYAGMSAVAIKAIQEQQKIIEAQAEKIIKVHEQLNDLEAELKAQKELVNAQHIEFKAQADHYKKNTGAMEERLSKIEALIQRKDPEVKFTKR